MAPWARLSSKLVLFSPLIDRIDLIHRPQDERDGRQGDLFMREIEPLAAHVPYMVSH